MSTTTSSSSSFDDQSNKSWKTHKEEGKVHYQNSNYEEALISFQKAIRQAGNRSSSGGGSDGGNGRGGAVPQVEHEILLSNSVACRLKIGGPEMAFVAVEEAKKVSLSTLMLHYYFLSLKNELTSTCCFCCNNQCPMPFILSFSIIQQIKHTQHIQHTQNNMQCIALNNKWAKAHIRLASAYIALGNHSNDACQSLQNALNIDPSNTIAKQMLMKELRRDRMEYNHSGGGGNNGGDGIEEEDDGDDDDDNDENGTTPIYVNENDYSNYDTRPSAPPMDQTSNTNNNNNNNNNRHNTTNNNDNRYDEMDIDDSPTIIQRIQNTWTRFYYWYIHDASDSWKSLVQVLCLTLILYIAFGGRFGLDSALSPSHRSGRSSSSSSSSSYGRYGDYSKGNAYEEFYKNQQNTYRRGTSGSTSGGRTSYDRYDSTNSGGNSNSRDSSSYKRNERYGSYGYNHDRYNNNYNRYDDDDYTYSNSGYGSNYGGSSRGGGSYGTRNYNNNSNNRYNRHHSNPDWDTIVPYLLVGGIVLGLNRLFGVPIHVMPMGFGMRRGFGGGFGRVGFGGGGFGPRIRFGRGGMRFGFGPGVGMGGYPMGGGRARFGRRRWY